MCATESTEEPPSDSSADMGEGSVTLSRDDWWAVIAALEGDDSHLGDALDALQRWEPRPWLEALDEKEEHARATWEWEDFQTGRWVCA